MDDDEDVIKPENGHGHSHGHGSGHGDEADHEEVDEDPKSPLNKSMMPSSDAHSMKSSSSSSSSSSSGGVPASAYGYSAPIAGATSAAAGGGSAAASTRPTLPRQTSLPTSESSEHCTDTVAHARNEPHPHESCPGDAHKHIQPGEDDVNQKKNLTSILNDNKAGTIVRRGGDDVKWDSEPEMKAMPVLTEPRVTAITPLNDNVSRKYDIESGLTSETLKHPNTRSPAKKYLVPPESIELDADKRYIPSSRSPHRAIAGTVTSATGKDAAAGAKVLAFDDSEEEEVVVDKETSDQIKKQKRYVDAFISALAVRTN
jgi:hypothetical protein